MIVIRVMSFWKKKCRLSHGTRKSLKNSVILNSSFSIIRKVRKIPNHDKISIHKLNQMLVDLKKQKKKFIEISMFSKKYMQKLRKFILININ